LLRRGAARGAPPGGRILTFFFEVSATLARIGRSRLGWGGSGWEAGLLASASGSPSSPRGLGLRPLRGAEPVGALSAGRREGIEPRPAEVASKPSSPGYGRPIARSAPAFGGPAAVLAQLLAQQESGQAEASALRRQEGYAAYRRMAGDDLVVVGPAGTIGLLL
jgi:hypothetical protein